MKDGEGSYVKTNFSSSNPTTYRGKLKEFVEKTNSTYSAMAECGLSLSRDLEGITSSTMGNQQLAEYNARIDSAIAAYQGSSNEFDSVKNQLATMTPDNGFEQVQDTMIAALTSFVDGISEILTGLDLYKGMDGTRTDQGGVLVNSGAAHIVEGADYIKLATQQYADAMP
ncbi:MAG: hypothetical protein L6427_11325 [Actinomycetia bacterium]|nr:hypothetical protein [Actinomycetes bacterium]